MKSIVILLVVILAIALAKKNSFKFDYAGSCDQFEKDAKTIMASTIRANDCLPVSPLMAHKDINDLTTTHKCKPSRKYGMSHIKIKVHTKANFTISMIPHHPIRGKGEYTYKRRPACMVTEEACTNKTSQCKEIPVELSATGFVAHFDRIYIARKGVEMNVCYINGACCHYLAHEKGICMMEHKEPLLNTIQKREDVASGEEETTEEERTGEETEGDSTETNDNNTEAKNQEEEQTPEEQPKEEMDKKSVSKPLGREKGQEERGDVTKKFHDGSEDGLYNVGDRQHPYKLPLCINAPGSLACVVLDRDRDQHRYNEHGYQGNNDGLHKAPKYDFKPYISKDGTHPDVNGGYFEVGFEEGERREHDDEKRKAPVAPTPQ